MSEAPRYATLRDYLRVVRHHRLLIVLCTLVVAGAALGYSLSQRSSYLAEASVNFTDPGQDFLLAGQAVGTLQLPEQRAAVQAKLVTSPQVAAAARQLLKTRLSPGSLASGVSANVETTSSVVIVQARSSDAHFAARLANAFAEGAANTAVANARAQYKEAAKQARLTFSRLPDTPVDAVDKAAQAEQISRYRELARIANPAQVISYAGVPASADSPRPVRNTIFGALLGLALGLIGAFARDSLDRRFRSATEIRDELKLPLLGLVHEDVLGRSPSGPNGKKALSDVHLETFRILRTNVDFLDIDHPPVTTLVTSALAEEGKSTVACALAAANASAGKRTLLVECDLRRPSLAKRLGLAERPGLSDLLLGTVGPDQVRQLVSMPGAPANGRAPGGDGVSAAVDPQAQPTAVTPADTASTLELIAAGTPTPRPAELLASQRFADFLAQAARDFEAVVLDTSPVLPVVDTLELIPQVNIVLLCVRGSRTTRDQARAARAALEHLPQRPTGLVLTGVPVGGEAAYGDYSAYAYRSA